MSERVKWTIRAVWRPGMTEDIMEMSREFAQEVAVFSSLPETLEDPQVLDALKTQLAGAFQMFLRRKEAADGVSYSSLNVFSRFKIERVKQEEKAR